MPVTIDQVINRYFARVRKEDGRLDTVSTTALAPGDNGVPSPEDTTAHEMGTDHGGQANPPSIPISQEDGLSESMEPSTVPCDNPEVLNPVCDNSSIAERRAIRSRKQPDFFLILR